LPTPTRRLLNELVGAFAAMLLSTGRLGYCSETLISRVLSTGFFDDRSHQAQTQK